MLRTTSARLLVGACALTIAGGGVATAQSPAPPVSFTYMTFVDQATDQVGACIEDYTASHPNVTISYQIVDHDALQQKLITQVETNTLPDMFWWNGQLIVDAFNKSDSVLDLTPYLDEAFTGTLIDGALTNLTTADGKIVGFPANAEVQGWVFNKALFDQYGLAIPTTYDELKAAVPVFRENGIDTIAYGSKEGWAVWGFQHWLVLWGIWQQAEQVFGDHSIKAVDADFQRAYEAEAELYALGAFPANNATMSFDQAVSAFNNGTAAMITLPSDQLGKIIGQPNEANYVMNWGITFPESPYPQDVKVRNVGNGYGISANVANDPAKLAAIVDFNKWRFSQEGYDCALETGAIMPAQLSPASAETGPIMTQQAAMMADPDIDTTVNLGLNSDYAPYRQWNSDGDLWAQGFGNIRGNLENSLMNGSMTAGDIPKELARMDTGIDEVLETLAQP